MSIPISQFIPPPLPSQCPHVCVSIPALQKGHLYCFVRWCVCVCVCARARAHAYTLIYDVSFSDLTSLCMKTLGPSISLQMTNFIHFWPE